MKKEYEESKLKWSIEDIYIELPQCTISPDALLPQKFQKIIAREKDLEETIENMKAKHEAHIKEIEAEHKARIVDLETKAPGTPTEERKAWAANLKACVATIDTFPIETQKLLDEATQMWTTMEEIHDLIEVRISLQKNQQKFNELTVTMKDLSMLEHMLKMKESTKLQSEL